MRDCRSMVGLIDAVQVGKLQAMIVAQRAGYFGGSGKFAQATWVGMGFGFSTIFDIALANYAKGTVTFWQGAKSGLQLSWVFFGFTVMRAYYLHKLELHEAQDKRRALAEEAQSTLGAQSKRGAVAHRNPTRFDPRTGKPVIDHPYVLPLAPLPQQHHQQQQQQQQQQSGGTTVSMRTSNVLKYSVGQHVQNMGAYGASGHIASLVADAGAGGPGVMTIRRDDTAAAAPVLNEDQIAAAAEKDAKEAAQMLRVKEENVIAQMAHRGLMWALGVGAVALFWFPAWYSVQCPPGYPQCFDLYPAFPSRPSTFLSYSMGVGSVPASFLIGRCAWLVSKGEMQKGQVFLVRGAIVIGITYTMIGIIAAGGWPTVLCIACGIAMMAIGAGLQMALRKSQMGAMTPALEADVAAYNVAWQEVIGSHPRPNARGELQARNVQALFAIEVLVNNSKACQKARRESHEYAALGLKGRDTRDQLMIMITQAWGLNDKFQRFAKDWKASVAFGGDMHGGDEAEEKGLLPKRRQRAIEKVWRAYGGDATRLRDLVRCSIVFDAVTDMHQCLRCVLEDRRIAVLEIKNRVSFKYNSDDSCGYRDIQLKIVVERDQFNEDEIMVGLHEHVCEVQLHLDPIYKLKNDDGHKRYVTYRNQRAE